MPVEDPAHGVGHRFVMVITFDQYREQAGDRATAGAGTRPFEQARQFGKQTGRVAARGGRLAGGKANFTQCETEPRDAVHQQQNGFSLVAEVFGDGHGGVCGFTAQQWWLIGRGDHDDRAGDCRAEVVFDELAHLTAAFSDQGKHHDVAIGLLRQHGEQRGFPHTRPSKKPEPLPGTAGREQVERVNAERDSRTKAAACRRRRRGGTDRPERGCRQRASSIERRAQRVDHPAEPGVTDRQARLALPDGHRRRGARADTGERSERHGPRAAVLETNDLRLRRSGAPGQREPVTDRKQRVEPGNLERDAGRAGDLTKGTNAIGGCKTGSCAGEAFGNLELQHRGRLGSVWRHIHSRSRFLKSLSQS